MAETRIVASNSSECSERRNRSWKRVGVPVESVVLKEAARQPGRHDFPRAAVDETDQLGLASLIDGRRTVPSQLGEEDVNGEVSKLWNFPGDWKEQRFCQALQPA